MKTSWTEWARARLLPFPGETWRVDVDLAAVERRLAKAGAEVPAAPTGDREIERATALRIHEQYDAKGNHPRDTHGRDLVDLWVARAGVVFATRCVIGACSMPLATGKPYGLRIDAQPWSRLREHLFAAADADRAAAHALAEKVRDATSELRQAVAFAFVDETWVAEDLEAMFEAGYGQLALLAALTDPDTGRAALKRLIEEGPDADEYIATYQLVENGVWFMPPLMTRLADSDSDLVVRCAERAWNNATRKPWLEVVACLDTAKARAFLVRHGVKPAKAAAPSSKKASKKTPATKAPVKKAPVKKAPAKKAPAKKAPAKRAPTK